MGLANLGEFYKTSGLAPGYVNAVKQGADLNSVLANTAQTEAQTQRYTGETPSFLRRSAAEARNAELGNLQPEAEATLGVPKAKAGASLEEAKLTAQKAEEARRQLGPAKTIQILNEIEKENTAVFDVMRKFLNTYPTADQALEAFTQKFPQYTQDPQFKSLSSRYKGMPSDKAVAELDFTTARIAKGISNARAEQAAELQKIALQGQNQKEIAHIQGGYTTQAAQTRASADNTKPSKEQFIYSQFKSMFPKETEEQISERVLTYLAVKEKEESGGLIPDANKTVTTGAGGLEPRDASGRLSSGTATDPNLAKLPAGSKALGNGIYQLPDGRKVKAN